MSPAEGDAGSVTVTAPDVVLTKNPEPLVAVKGLVFAVVHQSTVPVPVSYTHLTLPTIYSV